MSETAVNGASKRTTVRPDSDKRGGEKSGAASRVMAPRPWRGCHRASKRTVLRIRRAVALPSCRPRFRPRLRGPEFRGLDTVALHLEVQSLVVHSEESPPRSCSRAWREG